MLHDYIIGYLDRHGCENVEDLEGYAENLFSSSWRLYCRCSRCLVVTMGIFLFFVLFICLVFSFPIFSMFFVFSFLQSGPWFSSELVQCHGRPM
ncbi:hypothetical protein ASPFODRAFT_458261 [Aspergillus luchuensis CBS 106.47]|uniref:Uncharacterized protein n=1 Tax=Aspergillus luchuensis (strain CBS 106.47) TaxID=1137211 RepID=A0A1M3T104_ASPLC|nr:hypothetical protein ASPFODRAFT_458261 [Aspergillus luchuensis CBS 106.47]